ncbi:hypothetical protein MKX01_028650 [Papaver californicum]|nr:hypothetical protein MKX01_028650 [Papaver californicum]
MLANIDLRCRDIFACSEPFGNVSIVLAVDTRQLPPVFDTPLYAKSGLDRIQLQGSLSYSVFDHFVQLGEVFRQSEVEELFLEMKNNFKHALSLFHNKSVAASYNHEHLKELGNPDARIVYKNNCKRTKILLLTKGSRVMLRKNLSTQHGLVNGSTRTVMNIVYANGKKSPTDLHVAVVVDFDKFIGPKLYQGSNVLPITLQTTSWISASGVTCQRTQLPLILCWDITVHKS